jgi:octaheme c-type cytochrome (tetrathionate reductase family)
MSMSGPVHRLLFVIVLAGLCCGVPVQAAAPPVKDAPPESASQWVAPDQEAAKERAAEVVPFVGAVRDECRLCRQQRLRDQGLGVKDQSHSYFLLDSPIIRQTEDHYGPVRFMHAKHAVVVKDCALCHHHRPLDEAASETVRCSACHQQPFQKGNLDRLGLKAAYHQQCMGCHREMDKGPIDCAGCHRKNAPDHKDKIQLADHPEPSQVTAECLRCHKPAGEDMLKSAHWLWKGPSPYTLEHRKDVELGKATLVTNNFCIGLASNEPRCTSCHVGYGWKDNTFDFTDMTKIDCLVCHDTTGTYKKTPTAAGMPDPKVDLVAVAKSVGLTSRKTCGDCHFNGGGGEAVKHADLSRHLLEPPRNCDIHMGGYDFRCAECHRTRNHKIAGRSSSVPVVEGSMSCTNCHSNTPHYGDDLLDHHLNKHCNNINCNTCHAPVYAKCKPTKVFWDWSKAGDKGRKVAKDKYGMDDYFWKKGEFTWKESAKPVYAWYGGFMKRVLFGDQLDRSLPEINITEPVGSINDPNSKISPFKIMKGVQAVDAKYNHLLVPHLYPRDENDKTAYWKNRDWQKAFADGMKVANMKYSGKYEWIATNMYWGVEHEVMPADMALSCVQCHASLKGERTCDRCHQDNRDVDFKAIAHKGTDFSYMASMGRDVSHLVGSTDYIDFKALGYKGDPIIYGGRFKKLPMGYKARE